MSSRRTVGIVCTVLAVAALLFGSGILAKALVDKKECDARACPADRLTAIGSSLTRGAVEVALGVVLLVAGAILMREPKKMSKKKK